VKKHEPSTDGFRMSEIEKEPEKTEAENE